MKYVLAPIELIPPQRFPTLLNAVLLDQQNGAIGLAAGSSYALRILSVAIFYLREKKPGEADTLLTAY